MTSRLPACSIRLLLLVALALSAKAASSAEPLAPRIDQLIEAGQVGPVAPLSSDSDFLRRITLDLTGDLPSSAEARASFEPAITGK